MYEQIARYYDLIHAHLTADIDFVQTLARDSDGPILELGCGSGRLLLPLARAGYRVTGVDNSVAMLARAQERLAMEPSSTAGRVTLVNSEMADLDLTDKTYEFALIGYNTFMHVTPSQSHTVLKRIRQHLVPGGRLLIDLANPHLLAQTSNDRLLTLETSFTDPETGHLVLQLASNSVDQVAQTLDITWLYDRVNPEGGPVHRLVNQVQYHYRYPHQLVLQFEEAGFQVEEWYGDYEHAPFDEDSERLLVIGRRL